MKSTMFCYANVRDVTLWNQNVIQNVLTKFKDGWLHKIYKEIFQLHNKSLNI